MFAASTFMFMLPTQSLLALFIYSQGRTGRGVRGVRLPPLASDSKLCRTVNLRREKKGKREEERKRKKREIEKKKGENEKEEEEKEEKGKKDHICLYIIVCIEIYSLYRGYGMQKEALLVSFIGQ